ncbi:MAG TPA: hypothetical protein VGC92_02875, partial [Phenylobacterium sp.]
MSNADKAEAAVGLRPTRPQEPDRDLRPWRRLVTLPLLAGLFIQAMLAGAMMSGVSWARTAHAAAAFVLIAWATAAGLGALINLRRAPGGLRLGLTLLALAAVLFLQAAVGALTA